MSNNGSGNINKPLINMARAKTTTDSIRHPKTTEQNDNNSGHSIKPG
jgi:hypothetical protein